ncbi:MAG: hypothetical protein L0387_21400 [Acidobacteria bacterium]|nr:hypothetical protein [Acidobacteriota bacterium]
MKIAILGWGSLIWDPRDLPREGIWQVGGPTLPIEFSRVSYDGRLTLVIDPANGVPCSTQFVLSSRSDIEDTICDLSAREGTISERIGYVGLKDGTQRCTVHPPGGAIIQYWATVHSFDAVVWTDLPTNFEDETGFAFSIESAEAYLRRLPKCVAKEARKYIENAPPEVQTPLRRRLLETAWLRP